MAIVDELRVAQIRVSDIAADLHTGVLRANNDIETLAGRYGVDLESLDGSVSRLAAFDADIDQQLETLDALIRQLVTVWTGSAADTRRYELATRI